MALYELKNEQITLAIESKGAEMKSLKCNETGLEYLWHADPAFWGRTSPVLFPVVGNYKDKTTYYEGKPITLSQHGFARDTEFELVSQNEDTIWFTMNSTEETYALYPFHFRLSVGYKIEANKVTVLWKVENPDEKVLHFSIGAHPAFNCPLKAEEKQEDYFLFFDTDKPLESSIIGADGFVTEETEFFHTEGGKLAITANLFDNNTMVIEHDQTHEISLLTPEGREYVKVTYTAPLVGIWTPIEKNAPFICIEPWYGRSDRASFNQQLAEREYGQKLAQGEIFEASYQIEVK